MIGAPTILLVDDHTDLRALFRKVLERAGYGVMECKDGVEALELLQTERPSLIVLDVEMPRMDGWKTLAALRERRFAQPVLMVTHVNDVDSRVQGLEAGADDYIGKPCDESELLARVGALLRRHSPSPATTTLLRFGDVVVDLEQKTATRDEVPVRLTRTEFALLDLLYRHSGQPVSRKRIFEQVWGGKEGNSHTLDTHFWRLRQKLGDDGDKPRWILNHSGLGYTMAKEVTSH